MEKLVKKEIRIKVLESNAFNQISIDVENLGAENSTIFYQIEDFESHDESSLRVDMGTRWMNGNKLAHWQRQIRVGWTIEFWVNIIYLNLKEYDGMSTV